MGNSSVRLALLGFVLSACQSGGNDGQPQPTAEASAVAVVSASPASGATGVPAEAQVVVFFSEPIDPSTATPATLTLFRGGNQVAGSVSSDGSSAVFTPAANLGSEVLYRATVTTGIHDPLGKPLAEEHSWTFTTRDGVPPVVVGFAPPAGATFVATGTAVDVFFSESIKTVSEPENALILQDPNATPVPAQVTVVGLNQLRLVPDSPLAESTTYTARLVATEVADLAGNTLLGGDLSWDFKTTDTVPPTVLSVVPPDGATGVATAALVQAFFSEPLEPLTVHTGTFSLASPAGPVAGTVTYDPATSSASFQPAANLVSNTVYQATLTTGIADLAGNFLASDYSWSFTTVPVLIGTPVLIETEDLGHADQPQLVGDGQGNFLAAWIQDNGNSKNVMANRYDASLGWGWWPGGVGNAGPVAIDTLGAGASSVRLDVNASGDAVAVWIQIKKPFAARFDPATGLWSAPASLVTSSGTSDQPDVALDSNGDALVVWELTATKKSIRANFSAKGGAWVGESLVETDDTGNAESPDALLRNGVGYAIWQQKVTTAGVGDGMISIWSSSVAMPPPSPWPAPVAVEQNADGNAANPAIAFDGAGNLVACWQQKVDAVNAGNGVGDDFDSVYGNVWTAGVWGTPQLLEFDDTGDATNPRLAPNPSGDIMALWSQDVGGPKADLFSQRYDGASGQWISASPELAEFDVAEAKDHGIAGGPGGSFRAVWVQIGSAGFFNAYTNLWTSPAGWGGPIPIEIDETGDAETPKVAFDGSANPMPMTVWSQKTSATNNKKSIFANSLQ